MKPTTKPRAPLALHPDVLRGRYLIDPATGDQIPDATISSVRNAFASGFEAMEKLSALRDAVAGNVTMTAGARELKLQQAALRAGDAAAKRLDDAKATLDREMSRLQAETLPAPPRDPAIAAEIRSALRSMSDKERAKILADGVESGDAETVGAVLSGPRFLSGVSESQANLAAMEWRRTFHAEEAGRIERLAETAQAINLGSQAMLAHVKAIAESPLAHEAAAAHEATRAAEMALKDNDAAQPAPAE